MRARLRSSGLRGRQGIDPARAMGKREKKGRGAGNQKCIVASADARMRPCEHARAT